MAHFNVPIRVLITSSNSDIAHTLCMQIASGLAFGNQQKMILQLLAAPPFARFMEGLMMELLDSNYPLLADVLTTSDPTVAFRDISVAFLLGGRPTGTTLNRTQIIKDNALLFKDYGQCLEDFARNDCKVMVLSYFPQTMAFITHINAPSLPPENFSATVRISTNRAVAYIAEKFNVKPSAVNNVIVWGTDIEPYVDTTQATIVINKVKRNLHELLLNDSAKYNGLIERVKHRSAQILKARGDHRTISAARAACDQMLDWWLGTPHGKIVTMGILSDTTYGVTKDVFFGFPVQIKDGRVTIYRGFKLDSTGQGKINACGKDLAFEKALALEELEKDL